MSFEGRANHLEVSVPPPGHARADWEIAARLAEYVGFGFGHRSSSGLWEELGSFGCAQRQPQELPDPQANGQVRQPTADLPLVLANETNLFSGNRNLRRGEVLAGIYSECAEIGSSDAEWLGIAGGDRAVLRSAFGSVDVEVVVDDRVPAGVVYLADGLAAKGEELYPGGADGRPVSLRKAGSA